MKLNLGSIEYNLMMKDPVETFTDKEKPDEDCVIAGLIVPFRAELYVSPKFEEQVKAQSFWHEVVHGIMDEIGRRDLYDDEGFTEAVAKQLYLLHKNNSVKKIYDYIGADKCLRS